MDKSTENQVQTQQPADQPAENQAGVTQTQQPASDQGNAGERFFTQEELNNIVAKEAKKAQEKILKQLGIEDFKSAKEGLEKFREWQESQKTEAQRQAERLQKLEADFQAVTSENETLKAQLTALKLGVSPESAADVVVLAKTLVSDEVDMEQAIQKVLDKYPHFRSQPEPKKDDKPYFSKGQHSNDGPADDFAKILLGGNQ